MNEKQRYRLYMVVLKKFDTARATLVSARNGGIGPAVPPVKKSTENRISRSRKNPKSVFELENPTT